MSPFIALRKEHLTQQILRYRSYTKDFTQKNLRYRSYATVLMSKILRHSPVVVVNLVFWQRVGALAFFKVRSDPKMIQSNYAK